MAKSRLVIAASLAVVALGILAGLALADPASVASPASLAAGGQLYDKWWKAAGVAEPQGDHPLWATQTTNTRKGLDTWRCKECHGWDYLGKDGAYGSGSHKTGFVGVSEAGKSKTTEQIIAILKGASNPKHDFSAQLDNTALTNLANFLKEGLYDSKATIDYTTKKPKNADASRGQKFWGDNCTGCHGADGTKVNFGTETEPVFIGTLALDNPQEVLHKIRAGQPALPAMPSGFGLGWTLQNETDVLAFAQTLPAKAQAAPAAAQPTPTAAQLPKTGGASPSLLAIALIGFGLVAIGWATRRAITARADK